MLVCLFTVPYTDQFASFSSSLCAIHSFPLFPHASAQIHIILSVICGSLFSLLTSWFTQKQSCTCAVWMTYSSYSKSSKDSWYLFSTNANFWPFFQCCSSIQLSHIYLTHSLCCWLNPLISHLYPPHRSFSNPLNGHCQTYRLHAENTVKKTGQVQVFFLLRDLLHFIQILISLTSDSWYFLS